MTVEAGMERLGFMAANYRLPRRGHHYHLAAPGPMPARHSLSSTMLGGDLLPPALLPHPPRKGLSPAWGVLQPVSECREPAVQLVDDVCHDRADLVGDLRWVLPLEAAAIASACRSVISRHNRRTVGLMAARRPRAPGIWSAGIDLMLSAKSSASWRMAAAALMPGGLDWIRWVGGRSRTGRRAGR